MSKQRYSINRRDIPHKNHGNQNPSARMIDRKKSKHKIILMFESKTKDESVYSYQGVRTSYPANYFTLCMILRLHKQNPLREINNLHLITPQRIHDKNATGNNILHDDSDMIFQIAIVDPWLHRQRVVAKYQRKLEIQSKIKPYSNEAKK